MNLSYKIFKGTKKIAEGVMAVSDVLDGYKKIYNMAKLRVRASQYHELSIELDDQIAFKGNQIFKEPVAKKLQTRIRIVDFYDLFLGVKSPHTSERELKEAFAKAI